MKFSFITPCLNAENTISDTIESVKREAIHFDHEHIVLDGKSSDGTLEVVASLADDHTIVLSEADKGAYDAMNKGIKLAKGEWIAILNADDYYATGAIQRWVDALQTNPDAQIFHGNVGRVSKDDTSLFEMRPNRGLSWRFGMGHCVIHPSMVVHRSVYERIGLYDLAFPVAADLEWFFRATDRSVVDHYIPEVVTMMRTGGLSSGSSHSNTLEMLSIHYKRVGLRAAISRAVFTASKRMRTHPSTPSGKRFALWWLRKLPGHLFGTVSHHS